MGGEVGNFKYDSNDLIKLLESLSLVHTQYSELSGLWLVLNRAKFDLYELDEPHHSIVLLTNVTTGEFVLRVLGVTRERGYLSSWDEFQSLCINRFRKTIACTGLKDVSDLNHELTQTQEHSYPFNRVTALNCQTYYKMGNFVQESELEGRGVCAACKSLTSGEIAEPVEPEIEFNIKSEGISNLNDEFIDDLDGGNATCSYGNEENSDPESCGKARKVQKDKQTNSKGGKKKIQIYSCILCKESITGLKSLSQHMSTVHPGYEPFACVHCNKTFSLMGRLYSHMRSAHSDRNQQYKCPTCDYVCCQINSLRLHLKDHEKNVLFEQPVKCSLCTLVFRKKCRFERHMKKRHVREHSCEHCSKTFLSAKELTQHRVTHTGERPFQCYDCGTCFGFKSTLRNHQKIHMRAKGMSEEDANTKLHYVCDLCGKNFSSLSGMQKHVKHVHERFYENIQCDLCGSIFKTVQLCRQHHEKVHSSTPRHQCRVCCTKFGRDEHLKRHMVTHESSANFACEHCGRRFKRKDGLDIHVRTHTGEKPFKCSICSWAGIDPSSYSRHKKSVHGIAATSRTKKTVPLKTDGLNFDVISH